ncbi:MAG TPA: hypothetical protein VJU86_23040 [Pyrinomonadaceae bacterium]|nr:hypothetical protein [Pyrinomonadaceae bacterium]
MSRHKSMPALTVLSLALALPLLSVACGSGSDNRTQTNAATSTGTPAATSTPAAQSAAKAKLNVNNASKDELLRTIPGMGNKMVHEFEEYRPYRSIQQFRKEIGKYVSPEQVAEYEKYIYVPIDENQSDAATLQQIPGLDVNETQELISGRPYASRDAFMTKLGTKISADELAIARTYMVEK